MKITFEVDTNDIKFLDTLEFIANLTDMSVESLIIFICRKSIISTLQSVFSHCSVDLLSASNVEIESNTKGD